MHQQASGKRRRRILVNVLYIVDGELAGAAIFAKNVLSNWLAIEDACDVVVLHSAAIDARRILQLPDKPNVIAKSASPTNFVSRILYEQFVLPFIVFGYDVYLSPTQAMPFLCGVISRRTKMIVTIHDMIPFFVKNKFGRLRSSYVKLISKWAAVLSDSVIVVSQNTLTDVVNITGIQASKLHVIYNFLDIDFHPENVKNDLSFLCISTVEPGKNLENTLKGYGRFLEKYGLDYSFNWIGKIGWGYVKSDLEATITSAGLQDKFRLLGYVLEEEKQSMLNNCTAMVYLSYYEGFGIPVLEGFYHNKPAVVSRSSSLPEVVGEAGILCDNRSVEDIADSLYELVSNLDRFRSQIPKQIQKFDSANQIKHFMEIIHE